MSKNTTSFENAFDANDNCPVIPHNEKSGNSPYSFNATYGSAQTNTSIKSAQGATLYIYITDILFNCGGTAGTIKLVSDPGGTPADVIPAVNMAINSSFGMTFKTPIKLPINKALGVTSVTVVAHSIVVNGFVAAY